MKKLFMVFLLCLVFSLIFSFLIYFVYKDNQKSYPVTGNSSEMQTVIVDAGHGGADGGAVGIGNIVEKGINLSIALKLREVLKLYGYNIIMTRTEDKMTCDSDARGIREQKVSDIHNRFRIIEANPDALFVSIHQNKYSDGNQWGTQVFYSRNNVNSKRLAENIQNTVSQNLQPKNKRIVKKTGTEIYLLYNAKSPAVLVECGFVSNYSDMIKMKDEKYQLKMALLITDGIQKYVNG